MTHKSPLWRTYRPNDNQPRERMGATDQRALEQGPDHSVVDQR